jgi:hypothetical protein
MKSESGRLMPPIITKSRKELVQRGISLLREGLNVPIPAKTSVPLTPTIVREAQQIVQRAKRAEARQARNSVQDLIPQAAAIAQAYTKELKSYRELAQVHNCTLPTIQALLLMQQVGIRKAGRVLGKPNDGGDQQGKISPLQRQWLLAQDLKGVRHSDIASVLGISRERVRQLCQRAGHTPRRQRARAAHEQCVLADSANRAISQEQQRHAPPSTEVVTASMLWTRGNDIQSIAQVMGRNPNSLGVQIARWRRRWPTMFARRYGQHQFKN